MFIAFFFFAPLAIAAGSGPVDKHIHLHPNLPLSLSLLFASCEWRNRIPSGALRSLESSFRDPTDFHQIDRGMECLWLATDFTREKYAWLEPLLSLYASSLAFLKTARGLDVEQLRAIEYGYQSSLTLEDLESRVETMTRFYARHIKECRQTVEESLDPLPKKTVQSLNQTVACVRSILHVHDSICQRQFRNPLLALLFSNLLKDTVQQFQETVVLFTAPRGSARLFRLLADRALSLVPVNASLRPLPYKSVVDFLKTSRGDGSSTKTFQDCPGLPVALLGALEQTRAYQIDGLNMDMKRLQKEICEFISGFSGDGFPAVDLADVRLKVHRAVSKRLSSSSEPSSAELARYLVLADDSLATWMSGWARMMALRTPPEMRLELEKQRIARNSNPSIVEIVEEIRITHLYEFRLFVVELLGTCRDLAQVGQLSEAMRDYFFSLARDKLAADSALLTAIASAPAYHAERAKLNRIVLSVEEQCVEMVDYLFNPQRPANSASSSKAPADPKPGKKASARKRPRGKTSHQSNSDTSKKI